MPKFGCEVIRKVHLAEIPGCLAKGADLSPEDGSVRSSVFSPSNVRQRIANNSLGRRASVISSISNSRSRRVALARTDRSCSQLRICLSLGLRFLGIFSFRSDPAVPSLWSTSHAVQYFLAIPPQLSSMAAKRGYVQVTGHLNVPGHFLVPY